MDLKNIRNLTDLINFVLYGDIHEVPITILDEKLANTIQDMDEEAQTRVYIATCLKKLECLGYSLRPSHKGRKARNYLSRELRSLDGDLTESLDDFDLLDERLDDTDEIVKQLDNCLYEELQRQLKTVLEERKR